MVASLFRRLRVAVSAFWNPNGLQRKSGPDLDEQWVRLFNWQRTMTRQRVFKDKIKALEEMYDIVPPEEDGFSDFVD